MKKILIGAMVLALGIGLSFSFNNIDTKANENGPSPKLCSSPFCWGT